MTDNTDKSVPKVGDDIYVDTSLYMSHGIDDFCGGLAEVVSVGHIDPVGERDVFISVRENPGTHYSWKFLSEKQERLQEVFGDSRAHPDPDYRPEFNRWD